MMEHPSVKTPILVTGAHRSGTTWVGKILSVSHEVAYISEPFNVWHRPGVFRIPVKHWYTYICSENEAQYLPALQEMLDFRYHLWQEIKSLRTLKDLLRMCRDWGTFIAAKSTRKRPLLKDPFAVFSIPWFTQRLGCRVVVTVRHPAAFVSSLKRLAWAFDFTSLLEQPLLMQDLLQPFQRQMQAMLEKKDDLVGQGSLLWRIIYQVIDQYRQQLPSLQVIRHEDLSLHPLEGFRTLYAAVDLSYQPRVQDAVLKASSSENPVETSKAAAYTFRLDSAASLNNWKKRLSESEIRRIAELTHDVASLYYTAQEWE